MEKKVQCYVMTTDQGETVVSTDIEKLKNEYNADENNLKKGLLILSKDELELYAHQIHPLGPRYFG
ncbi:hypothetical protein [Natranaerobius trueperi]|uniref:Uncharacterized protein n=1 Tax=Natranaerobius trueperi TaxID=759412 RepID=A0A226BUM3_9FIRM|nr:hypothetical protein [Natranaerobius trueperi]OWZ82655.1 hypothetical protein CDO51_12890 [Natranaerobius trueperi]